MKDQPNNQSKSLNIKAMTAIPLFSVFTAICSWIYFPIAGVPITLQTFAIFLSAYILGTRHATISLAIYACLGTIGLPVFSGFSSGIGHLFGPTGGYIFGFFFTIFIVGFTLKFTEKNIIFLFLSSILGLLACYTTGTIWFMYVYLNTTGPISILATLSLTVFPFVIFDIGKIVMAIFISKKIKPHIHML